MPKLNIGIVGCGAIGSSLAKAIKKDFREEACLVALYDLDTFKAERLSMTVATGKKLAVNSLNKVIVRSDLVIEAASSLCSWEIAKKVLSGRRDIMIMSAGGIASRIKELTCLAKAGNSRVYVPSGAIAGVDALKAARVGRILKVTLVTRKNPAALNLKAIKKDKVIFSGPAEQAVKSFPQNINVAAVLSLAGIGAEKTLVKIIASPSVRRNIHEVEIISEAGRVFSRTENIPHPANPKTSFLAVLSAIATLKQILAPVRIGT
jgi:aspartate dehydrogenase